MYLVGYTVVTWPQAEMQVYFGSLWLMLCGCRAAEWGCSPVQMTDQSWNSCNVLSPAYFCAVNTDLCHGWPKRSVKYSGFLQVEKLEKVREFEWSGGNIFWKSLGKWKIAATRCQIFRLKRIKFDFRYGSASDLTGGVYCAPPDSLAALNIAPLLTCVR